MRIFLLLICCLMSEGQNSKGFFKVEKSKPANINLTNEHDQNVTMTTTAITSLSTTTTSSSSSTMTTSTAISTSTTPTTVSTSTTLKPSTSTFIPQVQNTTKVVKKSGVVQKTRFTKYFCKCDLMEEFCDIDCCCDVDCSQEMLKVFTCKGEKQIINDYQFEHGLPSCKINEGWFCVFKDNSVINKVKVFNPNLKDKIKYSWPNPFVFYQKEYKQGYYKNGDPLILYNEVTEEIGTLDLPFSMTNAYCQMNEPLRHLENIRKECLMSTERTFLFYRYFLEQLTRSSIMRNPKNFDRNEIMTEKGTESGGDCITPEVFVCKDELSSCKTWTNASIETPDFYKIKINITHNFTSIHQFSAYFFEEEPPVDDYFWQKYQVIFSHLNESKNARPISGSYGYNNRNPLIVAKYVAANKSAENSERNLILNLFHTNYSMYKDEFTIHVPDSKQGDCVYDTSNVINFGESSFVQCNIRLNDSLISSSTNFTSLCNDLQAKAFLQLFGLRNLSTGFELYVSKFGRPKNNSADWIKLTLTNFEPINPSNVYHRDSSSFSCQNMIISVKYVFFVANIDLHGLRNQNVVLEATAEVGTRVDISFKLDEELIIPINFNVLFYDLTEIRNHSNSVCWRNPNYLIIVIYLLLHIYWISIKLIA